MRRLVRTELRKQRTVPTTAIAGVLVVATAVLVTVAIVTTAGQDGNPLLGRDSFEDLLRAPASVVTLVALVLGILGMAGEHRHRTVTTTFLAIPRRGAVVRAKLAAHALSGAALATLALVTTAAMSVPWLRSDGVPVVVDGDVVAVVAGFVASTALFGALGVAVGTLVRNQTAALGGVLVWLLTAEGLLSGFVGRAPEVLPAAAGAAMVRPDGDALLGALALAGTVAAVAMVGTRLVVSRDVT